MNETTRALGGDDRRRDEAHRQVTQESGGVLSASPEAGSLVLMEAESMPPVPAAGSLASEGHPDFRAGTAALAAMPDDEFEVRLIAMRRGRERITRIHRELMDPET